MNWSMYQLILLILNLCCIAMGWHSCPFNDGSLNKTLSDNLIIQAVCMYLTSPLEWDRFNPNTFDGIYYNATKTIPLTDLHIKRLFFSKLPRPGNMSTIHTINYWLVNGGGGSQAGMEPFGISMFKQIVMNKYHVTYPNTLPVIYLFQYRGAGLSKPSIHCHTATSWTDCARELIETTVPSSPTQSLEIIHAMSNQNIAQDLQYQIQYAINQSQATSQTSTYIYGLSQDRRPVFISGIASVLVDNPESEITRSDFAAKTVHMDENFSRNNGSIDFVLEQLGTGIIEYYLSIQSINSQLQSIDGVILDGVMSVKDSDVARNQFKTLNDRFYMYISKCQQDLRCSKAFSIVTASNQDLLSVTLRLQMLFLTNKTNPLCTHNVGLKDWPLFIQIANEAIENVAVRPLTVILIARLYRCSLEDQQVLSRAIPVMIFLIQQSSPGHLIDPPGNYQNDGSVLSIITIWSDYLGLTLNDSIKTSSEFYNDLCINSSVSNDIYLAPTGILPICNETKLSKYNYTLPSAFKDVMYPKNPRYWGQFQVNPRIFRSRQGGALLFNGDLDYNSPLITAQQVQTFFDNQEIPTKLVVMKGLTHVTVTQSYTKIGGFQSPTCTEQIAVQFLYQRELNLSLSNLDDTCNANDTLIGIDWFYRNPSVNQTLHLVFGNATYNYWGIDTSNRCDKIDIKFALSFLPILFSIFSTIN